MKRFILQNASATQKSIEFVKETGVTENPANFMILDETKTIERPSGFATCCSPAPVADTIPEIDYIIVDVMNSSNSPYSQAGDEYLYSAFINANVGVKVPEHVFLAGYGRNDNYGVVHKATAHYYYYQSDQSNSFALRNTEEDPMSFLIDVKRAIEVFPEIAEIQFALGVGWADPWFENIAVAHAQAGRVGFKYRFRGYLGSRISLHQDWYWEAFGGTELFDSGWVDSNICSRIGWGGFAPDGTVHTPLYGSISSKSSSNTFGSEWLYAHESAVLTYNVPLGQFDLETKFSFQFTYDKVEQSLRGTSTPNSTIEIRTETGVLMHTLTANAIGYWGTVLDVTKMGQTNTLSITSTGFPDKTLLLNTTIEHRLTGYNPATDTLTFKVRPSAAGMVLLNQNNDVVGTGTSDSTGVVNIALDPALKAASTTLRLEATAYTMSSPIAVSSVLKKPARYANRPANSMSISGYVSIILPSGVYAPPPGVDVIIVTLTNTGVVTMNRWNSDTPYGVTFLGETGSTDRWLEVYIISEIYPAAISDVKCNDIVQFSEVAYMHTSSNSGTAATIYSVPAVLPPHMRLTSMFSGTSGNVSDSTVWDTVASWDVSNVTHADYAFRNKTSFNPAAISNWKLPNCIDATSMFDGCTSLNRDLSQWCVPLLPVEPTNFATGTLLTAPMKPVWGTCPVP